MHFGWAPRVVRMNDRKCVRIDRLARSHQSADFSNSGSPSFDWMDRGRTDVGVRRGRAQIWDSRPTPTLLLRENFLSLLLILSNRCLLCPARPRILRTMTFGMVEELELISVAISWMLGEATLEGAGWPPTASPMSGRVVSLAGRSQAVDRLGNRWLPTDLGGNRLMRTITSVGLRRFVGRVDRPVSSLGVLGRDPSRPGSAHDQSGWLSRWRPARPHNSHCFFNKFIE